MKQCPIAFFPSRPEHVREMNYAYFKNKKRPCILQGLFEKKTFVFLLFYQVDFNSSVLGSTSSCVIGGDRLGLTITNSSQSVCRDSFIDQEVPY